MTQLAQVFNNQRFILIRDVFFVAYFSSTLLSCVYDFLAVGPVTSFRFILNRAKSALFKIGLLMPFSSRKINEKVNENIAQIKKETRFHDDYTTELPYLPTTDSTIIEQLQKLSKSNRHSEKEGKYSGTIYENKNEMIPILKEVIELYGLSNPLHPEAFPGVNKMEREVVRMILNLYNAPQQATGSFTSGGTESILSACKAYRDYGLKHKNIVYPEIVLPVTAHAAFDKACQLFKIKLKHIEVDENSIINKKKYQQAITKNTILIVGSAINFPHGIMDDISFLSKLAIKKKIPLHVDCCLGSFIIPFMEEASYKLPLFDFRLDGVTSISCDPHKYGLTIKGSSIIMYRDEKYIQCQYCLVPEWTGGIYATSTFPGSRPGLLIAATWASLLKRGRITYIDNAKRITECTRYIRDNIKQRIPQLLVIGDPQVCVVSFKSASNKINVYNIADAMEDFGWSLNKLQHPPAIHIACTMHTVDLKEQFIENLKESVEKVQRNKDKYSNSMTAFYGAKVIFKGTSTSEKLINAYLDGLMEV